MLHLINNIPISNYEAQIINKKIKKGQTFGV